MKKVLAACVLIPVTLLLAANVAHAQGKTSPTISKVPPAGSTTVTPGTGKPTSGSSTVSPGGGKSNPGGGKVTPGTGKSTSGSGKVKPGSSKVKLASSAGKPGSGKVNPGGKSTFNPRKSGSSKFGTTRIKNPSTVRRFNSNVRVSTKEYASKYGRKLKSGYYMYRGSRHNHWTRRFYSLRWRTWCWYDPSTGLWYYWCGAKGCYLPVRYLVVEPPTTSLLTDTNVVGPPDGADVTLATKNEQPDLPQIKEP